MSEQKSIKVKVSAHEGKQVRIGEDKCGKVKVKVTLSESK